MPDVAATKLATIQQRAQARDYEDLAAVLDAGIALSELLAAASAVYGREFNGALSLKAMTYFSDGDLPNLRTEIQRKLRRLASEINLRNLPTVIPRTGLSAKEVQG
jgi:Nucleotidyl transferase AbiEii toxin, Type IV TA system